jgi:hypothetical protein
MLQSNFWFELPSILIKLIEGSSIHENQILQKLNLSLIESNNQAKSITKDLITVINKIYEKQGKKASFTNLESFESSLELIPSLLNNEISEALRSKIRKVEKGIIIYLSNKGELCCESITIIINLYKRLYDEIQNYHFKTIEVLEKIQYFLKLTRISIDKANKEIIFQNVSSNCQKLFIMLKVLCEKYQQKIYNFSDSCLNFYENERKDERSEINQPI